MISVVVLTHNRLPLLAECLASIRRCAHPACEVVVVDNASADGTREAVEGEPGVRVVRFDRDTELSACRNAGIDAARGDIVAFTDDDCVVSPDWLRRIEEDLRSHDAVGGVSLPWGKVRFPRWWDEEINWLIGLSVPGHYGPKAGEIFLPASLNLAYRAGALRRIRFREGVPGLAGRNMTREDSDLWSRTRAGGYRTLFDPLLVVYHRIPPGRLTLSFCVKRAFSDGFAACRREGAGSGLRPAAAYVLAQPFLLAARALRGGGAPRAIEWVWPVRQAGFVASGIARSIEENRVAETVRSASTVLREGLMLLLAGVLLRAGLLRPPARAGDQREGPG